MSLGGRAEGLLFQARITQSRAGRGLAAAEIVELFRRCRTLHGAVRIDYPQRRGIWQVH
jgi:hypothetical protein